MVGLALASFVLQTLGITKLGLVWDVRGRSRPPAAAELLEARVQARVARSA